MKATPEQIKAMWSEYRVHAEAMKEVGKKILDAVEATQEEIEAAVEFLADNCDCQDPIDLEDYTGAATLAETIMDLREMDCKEV